MLSSATPKQSYHRRVRVSDALDDAFDPPDGQIGWREGVDF
jgi:hypothetical protein